MWFLNHLKKPPRAVRLIKPTATQPARTSARDRCGSPSLSPVRRVEERHVRERLGALPQPVRWSHDAPRADPVIPAHLLPSATSRMRKNSMRAISSRCDGLLDSL